MYFNHMPGYPPMPMDPNQAAAMMASSGVYQYGQHQQSSMLTNPFSQMPLMYGAMPPSFVPSPSMGIGMVQQQQVSQQVGVSRSRAGSLNATAATTVPMSLQSAPLVQIPFPDMMTTVMMDDAAIVQQHFGFSIGSQLNSGVGEVVLVNPPTSSIHEAAGVSTTEGDAAVDPPLPPSSLGHQSDSTAPSHLNHNSSIIMQQQQVDSSRDDLHRAPTAATVTPSAMIEFDKIEQLAPLDGEEQVAAVVVGGTETGTETGAAGLLAYQDAVVVGGDQESSSTVLMGHQVDLSIDISSAVVGGGGGGSEMEEEEEEEGTAATTTTTSIPQYSISSSGKRVYSKTQLVALLPPDRSEAPHVIPASLRDFYPPYVFERGSMDGSDHVRYPLKGDHSSSFSSSSSSSTGGGGKGDSSSRGGGGGGRPQSHRGGGGSDSRGGDSRGGGNNSSNNYSSRNNQHGNNNSSNSNSNTNGSNRHRYERVGNESPAINDLGGGASSSSHIIDNTPAVTPVGYKPLFQTKTGDDDPEVTVRKANFILNKLSVTKYDKLSDEFLALLQEECCVSAAATAAKDGHGSEKLRRTVDALLSKAQMEESFCFMYADLCAKIITQWLTDIPVEAVGDVTSSSTTSSTTTSTTEKDSRATESKDVDKEKDKDKDTEIDMVKGKDQGEKDTEKCEEKEKEKVEKEEDKVMGRVFRTVLLSRCQAEFEFDHAKAIAEIRSNSLWEAGEREEKEIIAKKRITGR